MSRLEKMYLFLIIVIFTAACVETDIYLPAFTDMMSYFKVSEEGIQKLLSWNFIGICVAGPIYGPLSDAFGRKKPLMWALAFFFVGSLLTMFAKQYDWMLIGRLLQGVGSGGCFSLGSAIIFDAFAKERAMKAVNMLNLTIPFLMAVAPLIGGALNVNFGFRSNFTFVGILVFFSLVICGIILKEPLEEEKRVPLKVKNLVRDFGRVFTNGPFWIMTGVISLIFAGYIGFLSYTSVLFVKQFGISKVYFPIFQAMILIAWLAASLVFHFKAEKIGIPRARKWGIGLVFIGGVAFAISTLVAPTSAVWLTLAMMPFSFGANWIMSIYFPEGMEALPEIKGITASLLTSFRLLVSAIIVGLASAYYNGTIYPISVVEIATVAICVPVLVLYERRKQVVQTN